MTQKGTLWIIFIVAVLSLLSLLYSVYSFNTELNNSVLINKHLTQEIKDIKTTDQSLRNDIAHLKNRIKDLEKDLEVTQELQRKQALAILELRKGKKK